jgi:acyl dehydratase
MKWFEDIAVGENFELGSHAFDAEEIVAFAKLYDPQPFHLSEEAGRASLFGGLSASGWHTSAIFMRLLVSKFASLAAERAARGEETPSFGPSPGFEDMKWPRPVLVGDRVTYRTEVIAKRIVESRPGWGLTSMHNEGRNQNEALVFAFKSHVFVPLRPSP